MKRKVKRDGNVMFFPCVKALNEPAFGSNSSYESNPHHQLRVVALTAQHGGPKWLFCFFSFVLKTPPTSVLFFFFTREADLVVFLFCRAFKLLLHLRTALFSWWVWLFYFLFLSLCSLPRGKIYLREFWHSRKSKQDSPGAHRSTRLSD